MAGDIVLADSQARSIVEVKARIQLVHQAMRDLMRKDTHYGIIPGCKQPSLYKPGAELLCATFRIAPTFEAEDLSVHDEIRYRVKCKGFSADGSPIGESVGECSSSEEKYRWRKAVCDQEFDETPEDRRRLKWQKYGEKVYQAKQVRTSPSDMANTVLKMAEKRALVGMVRTVTGASDIFTQDVEDMETPVEGEQATPVAPPKRKQVPDPPQQQAPTQAPPAGQAPEGEGERNMNFISEAQRKRFYAIAKGSGKTDEQMKIYLDEVWDVKSSREITRDIYEECVKWAEKA